MPRLYVATSDERGQIVEQLQRALAGEPDVEFAYLLGSFLGDLPFHDVDVAIMFSGDSARDPVGASLAVGARLEQTVGYPIDLRPLNRAPLTFQFKAIRGQLLVTRDEARVAAFIEYVLPRYFDLAPRLARAAREAFA